MRWGDLCTPRLSGSLTPFEHHKVPKREEMVQVVMWVGLVVAGVTLVILILSTSTSNNLSLSFNTNLYHFLNLNGTQSHCPPAKGKELCRKKAAEDPAAVLISDIIAHPASQVSTDGNSSKKVATSSDREESEAKASLAEGFSAWWQLQLERKVLIAKVCARYQYSTLLSSSDVSKVKSVKENFQRSSLPS